MMRADNLEAFLRRTSFVLQAAAFSVFTATLISSVLITTLFIARNGGIKKPTDIFPAVLYMCFFTMVPAGSFGFIAGALGGLWLTSLRNKLSSRRAVTLHAAIVGTALSLLFPFYFKAINRGIGVANDWRDYVFSAAVGCVCAVLFAVCFWKRIPGLEKHTIAPNARLLS